MANHPHEIPHRDAGNVSVITYYVADNDIGKPESGMVVGDQCYAKTTSAEYVAISSTAWRGRTRVIVDRYADVARGGAIDNIYSDTFLANTLSENGAKLVANWGGNFVTLGTESVTLRVYFNVAIVWDSAGVAVSTGTTSWRVAAEFIRASSSTLRYTVSLNTTGASGFVYCAVGELTGIDFAANNILGIAGLSTGVGSGTGDIVGKMGSIYFYPASA